MCAYLESLTISNGKYECVAIAEGTWVIQVEHSIGRHWEPHILRIDGVITTVVIQVHVFGICHSILNNIEPQISSMVAG